MIHPEIKKLLQEVFGLIDEEEGKHAGEYPEAYLLSLLESIKEQLPQVSGTLFFAVAMAKFGDSTEVFQGSLAVALKKLAAVQPNEKVPSHKVGKKSLKRRHQTMVSA